MVVEYMQLYVHQCLVLCGAVRARSQCEMQVFKLKQKSTGQPAVAKYMHSGMNGSRPKYVEREIEVLKKLKGHPNVIELYGVYENVC